MKLHRFIGDFQLNKPSLKVRDEELANQIRNVLKLRKEELVILGDGQSNEARARIVEIGRDFIEFEILERYRNENELDRSVILYCSILKKENFELVVQKATEVGVREIVPIISARTVKLDIRRDRLEKIIKEAAEQSGRGIIPALRDPIDFEQAIKGAGDNKANLFFDSSGKLTENFKFNLENSPLRVWIGPEGGWTHEEIQSAEKEGFEVVSIGKTTLRAETAAIIASYIAGH